MSSVRPAVRSSTGGLGSVDARLLAVMRCILAFAGLIIIYIDPSEPARLVGLTYVSLGAYFAYSLAHAAISYSKGWPEHKRRTHWIDVGFFSYLITLTEGTSSIFTFLFLFAILVASFTYGFREGLLVTAVSVASFLTLGVMGSPSGAEFELNRTLIRPVYIFSLGYLMARWGDHEIQLKRRLQLLKEVSNVWHPRFGVDHTIGLNLDRLLDYYAADLGLLVVRQPAEPPTYQMYTASRAKPAQSSVPEQVNHETARPLLRLPEILAATWCDLQRPWARKGERCAVYDANGRTHDAGAAGACQALANLLDVPSFVTVPYAQRNGPRGRLYLASKKNAFSEADVDFLVQWTGTLSPVVETLQLMDELISKASEHERHKISRDLHDTTIQPYIGLKLGLEALYRDSGPDNPVTRKIGDLIEMANLTIQDLRTYTATLRERTTLPGDFLVAAVREQAERYRRFYGIDVEVKTDINSRLTGRLAAEAYQIVVEGLSNILRHTPSKRAYVAILCETDGLLLKVGNEAVGVTDRPVAFTPRSMQERAQALDGAIMVEQDADGYTVVHVTIPM